MNDQSIRIHSGIFAIFLCMVSGMATANSGAPLISMYGFELMPWSVGLGVFEAILLWRFYKCDPWVAGLALFFGNLVSGWFGLFVFSNDYHLSWLTIYNFAWVPYASWLAAYVFSVLIEYPAYRLSMNYSKIETRRLARSIQACLIIHIPFYLIMGGWFLFDNYQHSVSGYAKMRDLSFMKEERAWVYYVSSGCDRVLRCRPDGTERQEVVELPRRIDPDYSFLWLEDGKTTSTLDLHLVGQGDWKLQEALATKDQWQTADELLASSDILAMLRKKDSMDGTFLPMLCADFRKPDTTNLYFHIAGRWYLYAQKPDEQKKTRFRDHGLVLQSPIPSWRLRNLTVLPGDRLIFALGDQICVLDFPTHRMGVITRGYRPLVVLEKAEQTEETGRIIESPARRNRPGA